MATALAMPLRLRVGMKILRAGPRLFVIIHPDTGAQLSCGPEQRYLLHLLQCQPSLDRVRRAYQKQFRRPLSRTDLEVFIEQLHALHLIGDDEPPATTPVPPAGPAPAPLSGEDGGATLNVFLDVLTLFFGWLLHPIWIVPVLLMAVLAAMVGFHNWSRLMSDLRSPWDKLPALPLALGLLSQTVIFVNLPRALSVGMACRRYGGRLRDFGFTFWNGLVPTFYCDVGDSLARMSDRGRWTVLSISMWCQVAIGSASLLAWSGTKPGSLLSIFWLWLVPPTAISFLFNCVVVFDFCGYYMLSFATDEPRLRDRAFAETEAWLTGRRAPEALTRDERFGFRYFGCCYYLLRLVLDPLLLIYCGLWMNQHFRGPGVLFFAIATLWWYSDSIGRVIMENETILAGLRLAGYVLGGLGLFSGLLGWMMPWTVRGGGGWWVRWPVRLLMLLAGLLAVAYTPYNYEIAGECRVIPGQQNGIRAQLTDEIVTVHVKEGDYVQPGQLIATLSGRQVRADIATTEAEIKHAEAGMERLLTGKLSEQIQVAQDKVDSTKTQLYYAEIEFNRISRLASAGAASMEDLDKRRTARDQARDKYDAAKENLLKMQEGFREENLRAAEAQIKKLEEKLGYYHQLLTLVELRSPIAGHVVTPYVELRVGQHVQPGDLVAVVQDTSKRLIEVAADDAAGIDMNSGMVVHVRLYGMWGRLLSGHVQRIALVSETDGKFGNAPIRTDKEMYQEQSVNTRTKNGSYQVRVYAELDEVPPNLCPDMTGFARIVVDEDDYLWRSLARPIARFLRTEVWYWLP